MNHYSQRRKIRLQKKRNFSIPIEDFVTGIRNHDRTALAKAITLVESNHQQHLEYSQQIIKEILPYTGESIRIGITGVPGAGKSTFIEELGTELCEMGKKVAVLAIDPSSTVSRGSILGDKTRMENLAKQPNAFIRPSPSEGTLGGVHRKTREAILLCEAAGYEVIFVETIGAGQSEIAVRTMVDMFIMLAITGAGDELQGMKKGIMELSDSVVITKADGENKANADQTKKEYNKFLKEIPPATAGWGTKAFTCSAFTGEGILDVWNEIQTFAAYIQEKGILIERRKQQTKDWLMDTIMNQLKLSFLQNSHIKEVLPQYEADVIAGNIPVSSAAENLLSIYFIGIGKSSVKD